MKRRARMALRGVVISKKAEMSGRIMFIFTRKVLWKSNAILHFGIILRAHPERAKTLWGFEREAGTAISL